MVSIKSTIIAAFTALSATALPTNPLATMSKRTDTFDIKVINNCNFQKHVALFKSSNYNMVEMSTPVTLQANGGETTIAAPYNELTMRLSGHAEWGTAGMWAAQALFEFGYSAFSDVEGTAYDLSVMEGSDSDVGISVVPTNGACETKKCSPSDCPADQGWTNALQWEQGSPADTVCYHGKTDFTVTFCPS